MKQPRTNNARRLIAKYIAYEIMNDDEHFEADAETRKAYRNHADYILQIVENCNLLKVEG